MKFIINKDYKTIRDYLSKFLLLSKKNLHVLNMAKDGIKLNGENVTLYKQIHSKDLLNIDIELAKSNYIKNNSKNIKIEYEDEYILIASKPFGMKTHPNQTTLENDSLVNYLIGDRPYLEAIHRLDIDTCGLVVFSKSSLVKSKLDYMLEKRKIKRIYYALVKNYMQEQTIITNIGRDSINKNKMAVTSKGKKAITNILKCEKFKDKYKLTLSLETGRTHQIRVHLAYLNNPILGDRLYSKDYGMYENMYLGAIRIEFIHPITLEKILVTSSLDNLFNQQKKQ
ncbi:MULTISPECIES: RluA family pseudouridine synthase [unclassified Gemella]|uniref:RluA family pseudouridine synthase n=1 Tax=unclassified Gemella TaxID=2624949 RepID=UPI001074605A|nr:MULTISPECIES: RluA family pseudouridine synthase [unclassified Gemella]MBF0710255.1 RluA family pseudouridine synthase [Gemella sp. GL1.1]MBF0746317.1 RluA family pseudouridine synthase [Gemella sp. 19428wG2_WT2a]NYS27599.1 RluA family pseudouridine synthase [Gemella sp. GL1]TFU60593.1 RluA family pseudouridine synthase [Gemella sp. WT2a]